MDESFSGTVYRIAPPNFKPSIPAFDLNTTEGQITALRSPAIHTRYLGFRALKAQGAVAYPNVSELLKDENPWIAARAVWLLPYLGDEGLQGYVSLLRHEHS